MSNTHIKSMMLGVLDDHVAGYLTPVDVESRVEHMIHAIERVNSTAVYESRTLCARLVKAWCAEGALVPCVGDEPLSSVVADLRAFVHRLPE